MPGDLIWLIDRVLLVQNIVLNPLEAERLGGAWQRRLPLLVGLIHGRRPLIVSRGTGIRYSNDQFVLRAISFG